MFKKRVAFLVFSGILVIFVSGAFAFEQSAQESEQYIGDFSLSGFGERGKKNWDISGKSADIFSNIVKLHYVIGNLYGESDNVKLTANRGNFNRLDGRMHLEENVVITTTSGTKMTTNSLDWDKRKELVSSSEPVNITRDNMVTNAKGVVGEPNLNKMTLQKDVQVDILPDEKTKESTGGNKIIINCDGPLEVDYVKNIATFRNNVKVDTQDNIIYSDILNIYFISSGKNNVTVEGSMPSLSNSKIDRIVALGNVKIVKGENVSYCEEAIYNTIDKKIVLQGSPHLVMYSMEAKRAPAGN